MKSRTPRALALCLLGLLPATSVVAQQALTLKDVKDQALEAFLREELPELLSKKTDNFQLKYIEPSDADDKPGWGIDYAWKIKKESAPSAAPADGQPFTISRLSYELAIDGSYVFDDARNNQDLSTITANLKLARGSFGKLVVKDEEIGKVFQRCLLAIPFPTAGNEAAYDRDQSKCVKANGIDKLIEDEPGASYYWLDFHGGVEANQDYSQTHTLFGLAGAYSYQPAADHARYNVFDAPFRLLRQSFSGQTDTDYTAPYPSLLLGIERLDADEKDPRSALTTDRNFTRAKAEIAFNTQVANLGGQIVRLNASYRYFKELSAPSAVKAADLDEFNFFTVSLRFPAQLLPLIESNDYELFVSYTSGKLPFGVESDQAFEIGISTNVQALADFLSR